VARTYRPGALRRLLNVAMTAGLRVGLAPPAIYLLTTTGRLTGKRRTTPVTLVEGDDGRFLVAPYGEVGWVHNARASGDVTLARGRRSSTHAVTELGAAEAAPVLERYYRAVPVTRPYFDVTKDSPLADFEAEAPRHPVFLLGPPR
jgi:deazaflavin-dependent oxidoreductase (nitroreductase family)